MYQATTVYFFPKLYDLVLFVMPNVYDTPIQCYPGLCNGAAFAMRKRNFTLFTVFMHK